MNAVFFFKLESNDPASLNTPEITSCVLSAEIPVSPSHTLSLRVLRARLRSLRDLSSGDSPTMKTLAYSQRKLLGCRYLSRGGRLGVVCCGHTASAETDDLL